MRSILAASVLLTLLCSAPAAAQRNSLLDPSAPLPDAGVGIPGDISGYGTNDFTVITVTEFAFLPFASTMTYSWDDGRFMTSVGSMQANLQLPAGVRVEAWELEACDTSDAGSVIARFYQCAAAPGAGCDVLDTIQTGLVEVPGCTRIYKVLPVPLTVQNVYNRYVLEFIPGTITSQNRLRAVRVGYKRQVSPAPAAATFADVPVGSALHQYVEALVDAGITAGCGDGNFCPGAAVTRGQIAVFLAKALGLHWAP